MMRQRMFVLLALCIAVCSAPAPAQAFSFMALSFDVLNLPAKPVADTTTSEMPAMVYSDAPATDAVKEATDSGHVDEAFLNDYFKSKTVQSETGLDRVLPLSPLVVKGISTYFSSFHPGIDIRADIGSPVMALRDGVVLEDGYQPGGYGHYVVLGHTQGETKFRSLYAHLKASAVSVGATVSARDTVGYVGMTGHTTGPHLHFETRICPEGSEYYLCAPIDPIRYITKGLPDYLAKK